MASLIVLPCTLQIRDSPSADASVDLPGSYEEGFVTNLVEVHLKKGRILKMSDTQSVDQESVSLKPFSANSLGIISQNGFMIWWRSKAKLLGKSEDDMCLRANQKPASALLNHINPTGAHIKNAYPPIRRDLIQSWPFSFGGSNSFCAVTSAVKLNVKPVAIETPSGHFLDQVDFCNLFINSHLP